MLLRLSFFPCQATLHIQILWIVKTAVCADDSAAIFLLIDFFLF